MRWARFLASRHVETYRFDYGGVGESMGNFEDMGFSIWTEQVKFLANWVGSHGPRLPLVLHGLELGALFASEAFSSRIGDALLLWSVPKSANDVLRRSLWRQMFMRFSEDKSLSDYIRLLEADQPLEVDGYMWSGRLWQESLAFGLAPELTGDKPGSVRDHSVRTVKLDGAAASVFTRPSIGRYIHA